MHLRLSFLPLAFLFCQSLAAAPQKETVPAPVVPAPANADAARTAPIPAGQGSTTGAGKFVPAAAGAAAGPSAPAPAAGAPAAPPVSAAEAEKQLRAALKVEELSPGKFRLGTVKFDAKTRTVTVPAKVNMRGGTIEYVLTTEAGKAHESLLTTTASPRDLHLAGLLLGMKGARLTGGEGEAMKLPPAESVRISVSWETNGPAKSLPLAALLSLAKGAPDGPSTPMADGAWHYTGSAFSPAGQFAAEAEGSFISLIRDPAALLNNPDATRDDDSRHVPNTTALPAAGTPVTVTLQLPALP